jgi:hypothetical protein
MRKKLLAAALGALVALPAAAAPKAESAMECGIAADMAVVARSLAEESIKRPQAGAIMARIYDVSQSTRGKELMTDIIDAAYRTEGETSQKFAETLFTACMKSGGNMDHILGKRL